MDLANNLSNMESINFQHFHWNISATKLLLHEISEKKYILSEKNCYQKRLWLSIAEKLKSHGYKVNFEQCCTKWKNLKQKFKYIKEKKSQTGEGNKTWFFYETMQGLLEHSPEISPIALASSTSGYNCQLNKTDSRDIIAEIIDCEVSPSNTIPSKCHCQSKNIERSVRKRRSTNNQSLLEKIYAQREKHHIENMRIKKEVLSLYKKSAKTIEAEANEEK